MDHLQNRRFFYYCYLIGNIVIYVACNQQKYEKFNICSAWSLKTFLTTPETIQKVFLKTSQVVFEFINHTLKYYNSS